MHKKKYGERLKAVEREIIQPRQQMMVSGAVPRLPIRLPQPPPPTLLTFTLDTSSIPALAGGEEGAIRLFQGAFLRAGEKVLAFLRVWHRRRYSGSQECRSR